MANLPEKVRSTLDDTYKEIKLKSSQRKKRRYVRRTIISAAAAVLAGFILMNEDVQASFSQLFQGDRGVNKAISEGYVQTDGSKASDQGIEITLEDHFYDDRKLGMNIKMEFEDVKQLKDIERVEFDYRLKNGDGTYLKESIPDTKTRKGNGTSYFSGGAEEAVLHNSDGLVQIEALYDNIGEETIPDIKNATLEVESIHLWSNGDFESIDGEWIISMNDMEQRRNSEPAQYVAVDETAPIKIKEATANPTSLYLEFEVEGDYREQEHVFSEMVIVDSAGDQYGIDLFRWYFGDQYQTTTISTTFQISSYDNLNSFTFEIEGIGEVELKKIE
ncbi:DUF4179 domain-containing protein [Alkalicoccobacillus plakortidis]|uniref:DUF4179 domain-containing protein n=1 Tax=Alkalicoccobacillus plakortidis TaxID=444060 RepID=A0ABT0XK37_9BACI|nr:DUF4179 domain-containing protein [Alkalicoccobacillus plakortidis]MCM2676265.1 DUF4179 domain-containing protein [Alkalicoccobacillus plakortidis]